MKTQNRKWFKRKLQMNRADMFCRIELIKIRLIRNMRAGARLGADGEDSETTCQHKKKKQKSTVTQITHTNMHTQTQLRL